MRWILAVFLVLSGVNHFVSTEAYVAMMPAYLPAHLFLVELSGVAEILCGIGLMVPSIVRFAAWCTIALLVAVFPANLNMALHHLPLGSHEIPQWALWARLPLQIVLIWWAGRYTKKR